MPRSSRMPSHIHTATLAAALTLAAACATADRTPPTAVDAGPAALLAPGYSIASDLGTLPGGTTAGANAIGDTGDVVGWSDFGAGAANIRATRWSHGAATNLGLLPGDRRSIAWGVGANGVIVGESCPGPTPDNCRAFRWLPSMGAVSPLPGLSSQRAVASAVNPSGIVVGGATTAGGSLHAVRWTSSGKLVDLHPKGAVSSFASDINAAGTIAGTMIDGSGRAWAYRWDPSGAGLNLGSLGGTAAATAINDAGTIAGTATDPALGGLKRPFGWSATGGLQPVAGVPTGTWAGGTDLSAMGRIVGRYGQDGYTVRNGVFGTLPRLAGGGTQANGVNRCGAVVGSSNNGAGVPRAVIWYKRACD